MPNDLSASKITYRTPTSKSGNTSENLPNILFTGQKIVLKSTKIDYNKIMNLMPMQYQTDTIFTNSKNTKTSELYNLILNFLDKINLQESDKYFSLSHLNIYYIWENIKKLFKTMDLKYRLQHEMIKSICLMDYILYQILKIILSILSKT